MKKTFTWPTPGRILPDVFAFAIGLAVAWTLDWKTTDLVWSLWLCSLVLGYLTILSIIGSGVYVGIVALSHEDFTAKYRLPAVLGGGALAIFLLGFFSLHFCGFHAGHAVFLSSFFPIEGLSSNRFGDAFMNPFLLWKIVFGKLFMVYGVFLIPAIIAERKNVFASISGAIRAVREGSGTKRVKEMIKPGKGQKKTLSDPFSRPYINVIRMHLLIFFFAFCHMMKVESFFVYGVVYFVYFFPWKAFQTEPILNS